jgi:hypothetical protein
MVRSPATLAGNVRPLLDAGKYYFGSEYARQLSPHIRHVGSNDVRVPGVPLHTGRKDIVQITGKISHDIFGCQKFVGVDRPGIDCHTRSSINSAMISPLNGPN